MPNLLSTGTAFAGLFFDAILTSTGTPVTSTPVTVYQSDGTTPAVCYTDQTKTTTTSNVINTDGYGNLVFYTNPGQYILAFTVGGTPSTKTVQVNPWFSDSAWNVVLDTGSASPLSGDCRMASAASTSITETCPVPVIGTRVRIVKTDGSANSVTVATSSGSFFGPGLSGGVSSFALTNQGDYAEVMGDGSNYHVMTISEAAVVESFGSGTTGSSPVEIAAVALPPGTWDMTFRAEAYSNSSTTDEFEIGIGPNSGSFSGCYAGAGARLSGSSYSAVAWAVNISGRKVVPLPTATTVYLNIFWQGDSTGHAAATTLTSGLPNASGITAVQVV